MRRIGQVVVHVVHRKRYVLHNVLVGRLIIAKVENFRLVVDRRNVDRRRLAGAQFFVCLVRKREGKRILLAEVGFRRVGNDSVVVDRYAPVRRTCGHFQQHVVAVEFAVRVQHAEIHGNIFVCGRVDARKVRRVILGMHRKPHRARRPRNAVADDDDKVCRAVDVLIRNNRHRRAVVRPRNGCAEFERNGRTIYDVGRIRVEIQVSRVAVDVVERNVKRRSHIRIFGAGRRLRGAVDHRRVVYAVNVQPEITGACFAAVSFAHRILDACVTVCVRSRFKMDRVVVHHRQYPKIGRGINCEPKGDIVRVVDGYVEIERIAVLQAIDRAAVSMQRIREIDADVHRPDGRKISVLRGRSVDDAVRKRVQSVVVRRRRIARIRDHTAVAKHCRAVIRTIYNFIHINGVAVRIVVVALYVDIHALPGFVGQFAVIVPCNRVVVDRNDRDGHGGR